PEHHVREIGRETPDRLEKPPVDVDGVADRQKRVEADPERKNDGPGVEGPVMAECAADEAHIVQYEIGVLEIRKQREVRGKAAEEPQAPPALVFFRVNLQREVEVDER